MLTYGDGQRVDVNPEITNDSRGPYALFRDRVPPGNYQLVVYGENVALSSVPVAIQSGVEARASVSIRIGFMKTIEFKLLNPPENLSLKPLFLTFKTKSGETVVRTTAQTHDNSVKFIFKRCFAPGGYQYEAVFEGLKAVGEFTVAEGENSIVEAPLK